MIGNISSISYALPKVKHSVKDLCFKNGWDYKKLVDKTGVKYVYRSKTNENALSLAIRAAKKIKYNKNEIDTLIYITQSPQFLLPTNACFIQNQIKLNRNVLAFDINQGCSGYIYGLYIAQKILNKKNKGKILLICSDTYTKSIKLNNKTCSTIFSDGASASIISYKKKNNFNFSFFTDGSGSNNLILKNSGLSQKKNILPELYMDGRQVLSFTMNNVPKLIIKLLNKNNLKIKNIDYFVFHQASKIVIDNLIRILNLSPNKVYQNYSKYGNTVSSTIPICLFEMNKKKMLKKGNKILLCGFGVGLSAAATIMVV